MSLGTGHPFALGCSHAESSGPPGMLFFHAINPLGSFGHLHWDTNGNIGEGLLDVWCVGTAAGVATFETSGMTMDISTQAITGSYTACN